MRKLNDYVLVLWAERFDEAAATIFVTVLREAGLRVKVVGLTPPPVSGAHGLALVPDLSLDQALPLAALACGKPNLVTEILISFIHPNFNSILVRLKDRKPIVTGQRHNISIPFWCD